MAWGPTASQAGTVPGVSPELSVYEAQLRWLLGQVAGIIEGADDHALVVQPPGNLEGNNLLAIAKHATAVTRAYCLGIACGQDVSRDRSTEFAAELAERAAICHDLDVLAENIRSAFGKLDAGTLDEKVLPSRALYGQGTPREMTRREAIVESIRHLGIHLGEMRLTKSLLA